MSTTTEQSPAELVAAAGRGEEWAWTALTERYVNLLWSVARSFRMSEEDAADAVQNTWLRLLENLRRIERPEAIAGWLTTTTRNECLALLRKRGRDAVPMGELPDERDADLPALDAALLRSERDVHLWHAVRQLPERHQSLLRALVAAERPAYAEVSAALGMPVGSIGPTRQRCLSMLREILAGSGYPYHDLWEAER